MLVFQKLVKDFELQSEPITVGRNEETALSRAGREVMHRDVIKCYNTNSIRGHLFL